MTGSSTSRSPTSTRHCSTFSPCSRSGVYGVILAGFASRNNYAIMGGLRATGADDLLRDRTRHFAIVGVIMIYETMNLSELVRAGYMIGGWTSRCGESSPSLLRSSYS